MSPRDILAAIVLGALGIAAAGTIAAFASSVTGEEIGLDSEPVSVIPADAARPAPAPFAEREDRKERRDDDGAESFDDAGGGEVEGADDHGRNRGRGGDDGGGEDNSGPGSSGSSGGGDSAGGSSSSGSDSSGSGSSGSGGDEPEEPDD